MSKGSVFASFLILMFLLTGCRQETAVIDEPEATAVYEWMAGESPISNLRMGVERGGLNHSNHAVGPKGVYFAPEIIAEDGSVLDDTYIWYSDNGTGSLRKLCGRSDCTHDSPDCNSWLYQGSDLTYYRGKIYAISGEGLESEKCELVRIAPDGSQHETMLDLKQFAQNQGGEFLACQYAAEGYYILCVYGWKQEDGRKVDDLLGTYKYKLDGSMKEPERIQHQSSALYQCGDELITIRYETEDGEQHIYAGTVDLETDEETILGEHPGTPACFGREAAYYFKDGSIMRLTYATNEKTVMAETDLEGRYFFIGLPEGFILAQQEEADTVDRNLHFYNWAFELVDTVSLDYPVTGATCFAIIAETADRVILSNKIMGPPLYYIDKAELGTGNVEVYEFQYK